MSAEPETHALLRLSAGPASIVVDPADGGRLASLVVDGSELLGSTTPAPGAPPEIFHGSFVMAPFVGRTAHGRFSYAGEDYALPHNMGPHAMHGFAFDRAWEVLGPAEIGLDLGADPRWPFGGTLRQRFTLSPESLTVEAEIGNEERRMPAILGFHPWFTAELASGERAEYDFEPGLRYVCDDTAIPIGTVEGGGERPWDDSFAQVRTAPVIRWGDRVALTVESAGSHWIVCETMPGAFCVEPLSGPVNGLVTGEAAEVGPGAPLRHSMTLRWA